MYILMSIHRSPWTCALIAVEWISGIWTVGSWDIHILNLIWCWQIIYWDFQITVLVVHFFFPSYQFKERFGLAVPRESLNQNDCWKFIVLKYLLSLECLNSILTWKTWVSPGLLLESLLAWWTVGCFSLVFRSLRVSHRVSWSVRSMALPASPLDCFLPSLEPAIILEMNKSKN